jgi:ATP-dependent protease ClpP protease subunit/FtsZ-binding cell division protein ZapB
MPNKELRIAEQNTNVNPTEEEKLSGNYNKGKVTLKGLPITIENPAGSIRTGKDSKGNEWSSKMLFTYGYIDNTIGCDGDEIDVFLGPIIDKDFEVFIITQVSPESGTFDEHKVMLGFENSDSAEKAYLSCYTPDWKGLGGVTTITFENFLKWMINKSSTKDSVNNLKTNINDKMTNLENEPKVKLIQLEGEVIEDVTLKDLQKQAGNISDFDTLVIEIASPGGNVSEGLFIMVWMDWLSKQGKQVVTVVTANAYSIASLIMLAANHRIISSSADVMVHNPMVPELSHVNANDLEKQIVPLRELEGIMYELYGVFTGLHPERIKELMDNETYLSADEAVENNFADEVVNLKTRPKSMVTNTQKKTDMLKTLNILHKVIAMVNKTGIVNQLYYDDKGGEVEIFQNDQSKYETGDRISLENGEVTLSDGSKVTVVDNIITNINRDTVVAPVAADAPIEAPVAPVVPVASEGPVPASPEPIVEAPVAEFPAAEPVVAPIEPVAEFPAAVPGEAPIEAPVENPMEAFKGVLASLTEMIEGLKMEISELKEGNTQMSAKMEESSEFEKLATEAIDALANNTTSNFVASAKNRVEAAPTGSIFEQMKKKAGVK